MKYVLSLIVLLVGASFASAQCNVRSADTASAAAAVQNAQIQALVAQLAQNQGAAASAGGAAAAAGAPSAQAQQLAALLAAQNRAAAASAQAFPQVLPTPRSAAASAVGGGGCADGSCGRTGFFAGLRARRDQPVARTTIRPNGTTRSFAKG